MEKKEWTNIRHNPRLNVGLLHAYYIEHTYPRHSHDYYVVCVIERGYQSFTHGGIKHLTQPGGIILINPGEMHTGEATDRAGFEMRSFYPTASHMETAALELTGHHQVGQEKKAIQQARRYIEEHFAVGVSLHELAQYVGLSPYYFLRVFRAEVGMPPYTYLESVRIGYAQKFIKAGRTLVEAAVEAGFSSQSHMTNSFKKIIGVTPGQYAGQIRS